MSLSALLMGLIAPGLLRSPEHAMAAGRRAAPAGTRGQAAAICGSAALARPAEAAPARHSRKTYSPSRSHRNVAAAERRIYRLRYTNTSASDFRALFAGRTGTASGTGSGLTHAFRTKVEGEWVTTVVDSQGAQTRFVAHLRRPTVELWADGQAAQAAEKTIREGLSRDVVVVTDRSGRVRSVRFDRAISALSQSYARTLLALTQCVLPDRAAAAWTAEEEDPNGRYVARYQVENNGRADAGAVQTVRKTKLRYFSPHQRLQAVDQQVHPTVRPTGSMVAHVDRRRGQLLSLQGSERATMRIRGATVGQSATGLRLQYVGDEKVTAAELAALRRTGGKTAAQSLSATGSRQASAAAIQRRELGDATEESLLAELATVEAGYPRSGWTAPRAGPAPLYTPLYLKLKALIVLHPECCPRLGTRLAAASPSGVTASLLTGALSAVGHPQAQAALAAAIRARSTDETSLARGIAALAGVTDPTPLAESTVRWASVHAPTRRLRVVAEMALGMMGRSLADRTPARAAGIGDELLWKLRAARTEEEIRLTLMALGNAGSVRALPAIARYLTDASPVLRASAAAALRWIDSPEVDARLIRCLTSDRDASVRQEAAAALGFREPTAATVTAQQRAFRAERVESVRLAVLSNLGRAQDEFPAVRSLIRLAAGRDASPDVRKAAAALAFPADRSGADHSPG